MTMDEKTIEYAVSYLKIEKSNLEKFILENNLSMNKELVESARNRIIQIDEELLEYKKELNDTKIM